MPQALLAPRAWARPPRLAPSDFLSRFFGGQKVIFYKDAKLQEFSPYSQVSHTLSPKPLRTLRRKKDWVIAKGHALSS